ncbi:ABC transporter permease [Vibrio variabilis]|uniref:ABC transporter permease n=1 Tax=Vibrio variabilis TaxID=990271 RepID=UPI000DD836EB|nr:ABC transporter permease [Vibrio variabilis]
MIKTKQTTLWLILRARLIQLISVMFGVGVVSFVMMRSLPGDMAFRIAAGRYGQDNVSAEAALIVSKELGTNDAPVMSLMSWFGDLLMFNLGDSLVSGEPVWDMVWHQLGHSLVLAIAGIAISLAIAIPLGIASAHFLGWFNRIVSWLSISIKAVPIFVIGIVLIVLFSIHLQLFPVAGFGHWRYLVLPAMALGISLAAVSNRVVYTNTKSVLLSSYYQFAQIKGLRPSRAFVNHGIRNLSLPVVAFVGIQFVQVIEGIVMIESLFSWPGIGHGLAHAIFARDIPVIQGSALMMGAMFVLLNTLTDIAIYLIDSRGDDSCYY